MRTENAVLMKMARESLKGKWGLAVATFFVYFLVAIGIQLIPFLGVIASLLISGPMALGIVIFSLAVARNQEAKLGQIFEGFNNFGNAIGTYILMVIFIFLWMLLLFIPGIIAAFSYSMTFYILSDEESIGPMEAIDKSKKMMDGYKWKYFCLMFRFFGWSILCILTIGIGYLWLMPYMQVSKAKFYDDLKTNLSSV